jgi:hypothetical protein
MWECHHLVEVSLWALFKIKITIRYIVVWYFDTVVYSEYRYIDWGAPNPLWRSFIQLTSDAVSSTYIAPLFLHPSSPLTLLVSRPLFFPPPSPRHRGAGDSSVLFSKRRQRMAGFDTKVLSAQFSFEDCVDVSDDVIVPGRTSYP